MFLPRFRLRILAILSCVKDSVVLGFPETVGDLKIVHTVLLHRFITKVDRKYTDNNFLAKYF